LSTASKRFRVALSFAGEKRTYVASMASVLAAHFGEDAVLYDRYHTAEFARADLGIHLPGLYHDESELVVAVLCKDYKSTEWCGLEWLAIHDLLKQRGTERVMLCRFDGASGSGLFGNAGFLDLDDKTAEQAAIYVLERLALNQGKSRDYYLSRMPSGQTAEKSAAQSAGAVTPQSAEEAANNVPPLWNETIGRRAEIDRVSTMLMAERLVTIFGAGGSGKTRIAIEVAGRLESNFNRGVFFVDLASLAPASGEDSLVPSRIATVTGVREQVKRPPTEVLAEHFRHGNTLLILDNCEHLTAACVTTAGYLIAHCPGLRILATSRTRLGHPAERAFPLGPLSLPKPAEIIGTEEAMQSAAVQLFVRRVQEESAEYTLDPSSASPVAEVCRALDGLPLAIEVAARNLALRSVERMSQNSRGLLDFLGEMKAGDIRRWDSLSSVFQWSCDLLGAEDFDFMKALSVFDGGWNEEAAIGMGVKMKGHSVVWHLKRLLDHSLVFGIDWKQSKRLRFYEPMRQFVQSRMTSLEKEDYQVRHARYFAISLAARKNDFLGRDQTAALDVVQVEADNVRAALRCAIGTKDAETALTLIASTWRFCEIRGYLTEGQKWAERALAMEGSSGFPGLRAAVLSGAGILAFRQGNSEKAQKMFEESHDLEVGLRNEPGIANALSDLAIIAQDKGDLETAHSLQSRSLEIERRLGNERQVAVLQNNMGSALGAQGKYHEAAELLTGSVALFRNTENLRDCAFALNHLANIAAYENNHGTAWIYARESLAIRQERSDVKGVADTLRTHVRLQIEARHYKEAKADLCDSLQGSRGVRDKKGIAECLGLYASIAVQTGDFDRGVSLYAALESEWRRSHLVENWHGTRWRIRDLAAARAALKDSEFERVWNEGKEISLDEALRKGQEIEAEDRLGTGAS
jgi:predicted ATPase/Tfp pilus assembly protein PilF